MLDLNPDDFHRGMDLPRGWQFIMMAADTRRSQLRADGFPGLGVPMPDLGLPRLMLGSRSVSFLADIPIGAELTRKSRTLSFVEKSNSSGPMVVANIEHELSVTGQKSPALIEKQTYLLLPAMKGPASIGVSRHPNDLVGQFTKTVVTNETLLFQYSALGFNSHKIHIDRSHARNVEGYPDLVVNGGLVTLLLTEFLRQEVGVKPKNFKARHVAPLFCGSPITMVANRIDGKWMLQAYDHRFTLAVELEVSSDEF